MKETQTNLAALETLLRDGTRITTTLEETQAYKDLVAGGENPTEQEIYLACHREARRIHTAKMASYGLVGVCND